MWWGPSDSIPYCAKEGIVLIKLVVMIIDRDKHKTSTLGVLFLLTKSKSRLVIMFIELEKIMI